MALHTGNVISKIKLPGMEKAYEICDTSAIHSLADLEGIGLDGAFIYKGTVADYEALLKIQNPKVGWVYHVLDTTTEYVWITEGRWEEFGHHMVVDHVHDASLAVSGTANGTATVAGENSASEVTGTGAGTISVPKVSKAANYIKGEVEGLIGVEPNGTANPITGFGEHTTADAITGLATGSVNSATANDETVSKVTGNVSVEASKVDNAGSAVTGSAASWTASVDDNGILEFTWTANVPTTVTLPTFSKVEASKVTAEDKVVSIVTTTPVTVATGANGTAKAITALGAVTTATVLTGVKGTTGTKAVALTEATAADGVLVGDTVAVTSEDKTVNVNVTGTAAAQTWTQTSGTIEGTIAGTASGTTGAPKAE